MSSLWGDPLDGLAMMLPPGVSPGSQMQPSVPHWHQPPEWVECPARAIVENGPRVAVLSGVDEVNRGATATMNKQAKNLFIPPSFSSNNPGPRITVGQVRNSKQSIYNSLVRGIQTIEDLQSIGTKLATVARHAYLARQMTAVDMVSRTMLNLPLPDSLKAVGQYYNAILSRERSSRIILEGLVETISLPLAYRGRALQTLGAIHFEQGDLKTATALYVESSSIARRNEINDLLTLAEAGCQIAIIRSTQGDHKQALADLDRLFPIIRAISKYYPSIYFDYLNSLAVELGEVGRIQEAQSALSIALSSPYAPAYPEWSETRDEIAEKRQTATPSVVFITRDINAESSTRAQPRRVLASDWTVPENTSSNASPGGDITALTTPLFSIRITLDRLGENTRPRAPPLAS
jgi:hypothetical protein